MTTIPVQPFHALTYRRDSGVTCSCGESFTDNKQAMDHQIGADREIARFNERLPALVYVIDTLNRLHQNDPTVLPALIDCRVECNETVADDPTIQVEVVKAADKDEFYVGFLGILNGVFGIRSGTQGHIGADYDDGGKLTGFVWTGE